MSDERLSAWLDGELGEGERAALSDELEISPELRRELDGLEQTRSLLRSMGPVEPTPGVIEPGVNQPGVTALAEARSGRTRRRRWAVPAAAVAAVAAAWLLILGVLSGTSVARIVPAVDDYVDRHAAALIEPSSDGFAPLDHDDMPDDMPPMLDESTGLSMMGAYANGDVVQAVYGDGVHHLSVYLQPGRVDWGELDPTGDDTTEMDDGPVWHGSADGMEVLVAERDDRVVTVVADPGMDEMMMKVVD